MEQILCQPHPDRQFPGGHERYRHYEHIADHVRQDGRPQQADTCRHPRSGKKRQGGEHIRVDGDRAQAFDINAEALVEREEDQTLDDEAAAERIQRVQSRELGGRPRASLTPSSPLLLAFDCRTSTRSDSRENPSASSNPTPAYAHISMR